MMQNIGFDDNTPIQSSLLNQSLESAQKKVEAFYYDTRKQLFEYDQALNKQRNGVYTERKRIFKKTLRNWIIEYAERTVEDLLACLKTADETVLNKTLAEKFQSLLGVPFYTEFGLNATERDSTTSLMQQIEITYDLKEMEMEKIQPGLLELRNLLFFSKLIIHGWNIFKKWPF